MLKVFIGLLKAYYRLEDYKNAIAYYQSLKVLLELLIQKSIMRQITTLDMLIITKKSITSHYLGLESLFKIQKKKREENK